MPHKQRCLLFPEPWAWETIWSSSRLVCLCLPNSSSPPYPFWGPQRLRIGKEIKRCGFHVNNPSPHSVSLWSFYLCVFLVIAPKWKNTIEVPRSEKGPFSWAAFPTHRLLSWAILLPAQKMESGVLKNSSSTRSIWFLIITKPFCKSHWWHFTSVVSNQTNFPDQVQGGFLSASAVAFADIPNRAGSFPWFTAALYIIEVRDTGLGWLFCFGNDAWDREKPIWGYELLMRGKLFVPVRTRQCDPEGMWSVELDSWKASQPYNIEKALLSHRTWKLGFCFQLKKSGQWIR